MNSIIEYFRQSELALAAYANLTSGSPNKAALIEAGMSDTQANQFISKYTVVDQFNHITGASATVFQEIATGNRYTKRAIHATC